MCMFLYVFEEASRAVAATASDALLERKQKKTPTVAVRQVNSSVSGQWRW